MIHITLRHIFPVTLRIILYERYSADGTERLKEIYVYYLQFQYFQCEPLACCMNHYKTHWILTIFHIPQFTHCDNLQVIALKPKITPVIRMTVCFCLIVNEIRLTFFETKQVDPYKNIYSSSLFDYTVVLLIAHISDVH
jgi:hypothetical protein